MFPFLNLVLLKDFFNSLSCLENMSEAAAISGAFCGGEINPSQGGHSYRITPLEEGVPPNGGPGIYHLEAPLYTVAPLVPPGLCAF